MSELNIAGRPRRSTRTPAKAPVTLSTSESTSKFRVKWKEPQSDKDKTDKLSALLTNPKSKLTKIDCADVLNYENFLDLSPESQDLLVALLPPTSFYTFRPTIPPTHVDYAVSSNTANASPTNNMTSVNDEDPQPAESSRQAPTVPQPEFQEQSTATLDPTTFTSPFFLSAARTFQDHLFSGWFGKKAKEDLAQFTSGVREGDLHAEWKDEAWLREHPSREARPQRIDMSTLAEQGLLQEGDILSYRREFPDLQLVVEKDVLIDSIDQRTYTLGVLIPPGTSRSLHGSLLINGHEELAPGDHTQSMEDVSDPRTLEHGILDVDGRVSRADRHEAPVPTVHASSADYAARRANIRPWKTFTVWRWQDEMRDAIEMQLLQDMGGRERFGTLFYLRAHCR